MRINFRSRQTFMPQQLFYRAQISAIVQHSRCKGMPQHMRTSFLQLLPLTGFVSQYMLRYRGQALLHSFGQKSIRTNRQCLIPHIDIFLHGTPQFFIKRYQTLLIPFSGHFDKRSRKINILIIQSYQFRKPHTCRIKHFDNQTVAIPFKPFSKVDIIQQPIHFTFSQKEAGSGFFFFGPVTLRNGSAATNPFFKRYL